VLSCKSIQHKQDKAVQLPELGSIGLYEDYALENRALTKTIPSLTQGVRLQVETIKVSKRNLFTKKDSILTTKKDSLLFSFQLLDPLGMINQLNKDRELMSYLKKGDAYRMVTQITTHLPDNKIASLENADEVYLVQHKEKTLSLELRKENKAFESIEFNEGTITSYKASQFCWGTKKGFRVEILDLVPVGSPCSSQTYTTAKKAARKTEFKF